MLESMTKNDRHQVLLDTLIAQLIALLQRDKSRKFIAQQIVRWLESEHPLKAKILPTEWLGEHSAELVSDAVNSLLDDISRDRAHQIRHAFDRATFAPDRQAEKRSGNGSASRCRKKLSERR